MRRGPPGRTATAGVPRPTVPPVTRCPPVGKPDHATAARARGRWGNRREEQACAWTPQDKIATGLSLSRNSSVLSRLGGGPVADAVDDPVGVVEGQVMTRVGVLVQGGAEVGGQGARAGGGDPAVSLA